MANIDEMVSGALTKVNVAMPNNIVWKNQYNKEGELVEAGELLALIRALNIAQFQKEGKFDFGKAQSSTALEELVLPDLEIERAVTDSEIVRRLFSDTIIDSDGAGTEDSGIQDVPTTNALGESLFVNEALKAEEIMALLNAVKVEGLALSNNLEAINVSTIAANLDTLLASSIIHWLISDTIINQNIVVKEVLTNNDNDKYIAESELTALIDSLLLAHVESVNDIIGTINFAYIAELAKKSKLESTCQSTILRVLYTDLIDKFISIPGIDKPNKFYADKMHDVKTFDEVKVYTTSQIVNFVESYNAYI